MAFYTMYERFGLIALYGICMKSNEMFAKCLVFVEKNKSTATGVLRHFVSITAKHTVYCLLGYWTEQGRVLSCILFISFFIFIYFS